MTWFDKAIAVIVGVAGSVILTWTYALGTSGIESWQVFSFAVLVALGISLIAYRYLQRRQRRTPNADQLQIEVDEDYVFMRKWWLNRTLHVTNVKDNRIEFAERPAPIQGVIDVGFPLELSVLALWGLTDFRGYLALAHLALHGKAPYVWFSLYGLATVLLLVWGWSSIKEKRSVRIRKEDGIIRDNWQVLGAVAAVLLAWGVFRAPYGPQLLAYLREDYAHVWMLIALPALVWTLLRFTSYIGSYIQLTDKNINVGRVGFFIEDDPNPTIPVAQVTNTDIRRGLLGTLLGHHIVIVDVPGGQENRVFRRLRVKHGDYLKMKLDTQMTPSDDEDEPPSMCLPPTAAWNDPVPQAQVDTSPTLQFGGNQPPEEHARYVWDIFRRNSEDDSTEQ